MQTQAKRAFQSLKTTGRSMLATVERQGRGMSLALSCRDGGTTRSRR